MKGNLQVTENQLSMSQLWYAAVIPLCAKRFLHSNFNYAVIDKNINFSYIALDLIFSYNFNWKEIDQSLLPYRFCGSTYFSSYEPLQKDKHRHILGGVRRECAHPVGLRQKQSNQPVLD